MVKKSIRCMLIFIFSICFSHAAFGQDTKPLTLAELIEIALANNSQLRNAERQVAIAGTNVTSAYSQVLPRVNTSFQSGKYIQGARTVLQDVPTGTDPTTGRIIYEQTEIRQEKIERNSHSAGVSVNQTIFDFGRSIYGIKEQDAYKSQAVQSMTNTRQQVILNVKKAYYELLKSLGLVQVYQDAVKLADEQVERVKTMMEIGLASQAEVFQARVNLGEQRQLSITQRNIVEIAKADLNNALGRDPSIPIEIIEDAESPTFTTHQFEEAVKLAAANNPQIKALEMEAKANRYAIRIERAKFLPDIGFGFNYNRVNDDITRVYTSQLDEDYNITLGVGVDLNIFNGFSDKAAVQRQSLNYRVAIENMAEQRRLVTANVKQYFLELDAYQDILEINEENIEAATENLRLQTEKRRVGSGTELEVTEAQVRLTRAQSTFINVKYDAKIAKANLQAAMGIIEHEE